MGSTAGFEIFGFLLTAGVFYVIYKLIRNLFAGSGKISATGSLICPSCGSRGEPKTITKGSTAIELILWLCFIVPGLIYSIWRLTTRQSGCPACGNIGMIPANSPVGRRLIDDNK